MWFFHKWPSKMFILKFDLESIRHNNKCHYNGYELKKSKIFSFSRILLTISMRNIIKIPVEQSQTVIRFFLPIFHFHHVLCLAFRKNLLALMIITLKSKSFSSSFSSSFQTRMEWMYGIGLFLMVSFLLLLRIAIKLYNQIQYLSYGRCWDVYHLHLVNYWWCLHQ